MFDELAVMYCSCEFTGGFGNLYMNVREIRISFDLW